MLHVDQHVMVASIRKALDMKPYIAIVHRDPDSAYGITFPDAPGCFSAADSLDDLFGVAEDALVAWCEIMSEHRTALPDPRDLSDLEQDPAWAEAFSDAILVIALRPPKIAFQTAA